ncbi:MAG: redox-sensing transcriptional repressor Rex [Acidobacteriota bacterium]
MSRKPLPEPTLRRLPAYCHHLRRLQAGGISVVSCSSIGKDLGLDQSQIRKDLEVTGLAGKPRVGYSVSALINAIEHFLGWDKLKNAVLAGADSLGLALLGFNNFSKYGLKIVGVFEAHERLIGSDAHGFEVRPLGFLPGFARAMNVQVGIITVPAATAQAAADLMVSGGVKAIWNLAPIPVHVSKGVFVQNEDFYFPLAALSCRLARAEEDSDTKAKGQTA